MTALCTRAFKGVFSQCLELIFSWCIWHAVDEIKFGNEANEQGKSYMKFKRSNYLHPLANFSTCESECGSILRGTDKPKGKIAPELEADANSNTAFWEFRRSHLKCAEVNESPSTFNYILSRSLTTYLSSSRVCMNPVYILNKANVFQ